MRHCVVALIVCQQRVLLGHRAPTRAFYPHVWDLFGGHPEPGEQPHETLVRELGEELGIRATTWAYLDTVAEPTPARYGPDQYHRYRVTAWEGTPANAQPQEHVAIGWFSRAEALALDVAHPAIGRCSGGTSPPPSTLSIQRRAPTPPDDKAGPRWGPCANRTRT